MPSVLPAQNPEPGTEVETVVVADVGAPVYTVVVVVAVVGD